MPAEDFHDSSGEKLTEEYRSNHDKSGVLSTCFLRVRCLQIPCRGAERDTLAFAKAIDRLKVLIEEMLQEQIHLRMRDHMALSRASWVRLLLWGMRCRVSSNHSLTHFSVVENFHRNLNITDVETSLMLGSQVFSYSPLSPPSHLVNCGLSIYYSRKSK